jgi:hypothetical protein
MSKTNVVIRWVIEGNLMIVCSSAGEMPPERWTAFMDDLKSRPINRCLGLNLGTVSMTSVQRSEAGEIVKQKGIHSAVVTDDKLVRGIITAISWFGGSVRAYTWSELKEAVKYLKVPDHSEERVVAMSVELRRRCEDELKAMAFKK